MQPQIQVEGQACKPPWSPYQPPITEPAICTAPVGPLTHYESNEAINK